MNLHVFHDSHGFFLNLAVARILQVKSNSSQQFINLDRKTIYPHHQVTYLRKTISSYKKAVKNLPAIETVTFYPFDFTASYFLRELRNVQPEVRVVWVFWGYEYYHRPEFYQFILDPYSFNYYKKKRSGLTNIRDLLAKTVKKILGIPVYKKQILEQGYRSVSSFFSFLETDFNNIYPELKSCQAKWHPISFLSIEAMTSGIDQQTTRIGNTIMIGHAAMPSDNHGEVLALLSSLKIEHPLFIPLEYGLDDYRQKVKRLAIQLFDDRVEFLENRLEMNMYYRRLSTIGYAIFNFKWQEGLGNILFLIWNGAKVFLKENSSVSNQFKIWGLTIFSIEDDLNAQHLTSTLQDSVRSANKKIIEGLISAKKVEEYWDRLLTSEL